MVARKPAQSYDAGDDLSDTDAALLAHATGDHPAGRLPAAPLVPRGDGSRRWRPRPSGGARSPSPTWSTSWRGRPSSGSAWSRRPAASARRWRPTATRSTLVEAVRPDRVVLVADAGLGTINGVRLSMAALADWPVTVVLNRFDPADDLHVRNLEWLGGVDGYDVATDADDLVSPIVGWPS